ncbi:hypothetical protein l11_05660 [Neisseria weaveri LMG 5135]|nr:hypothetical protein l13_14000 [Neisseria weaveri ATCC 51223]EGV38242.1 hypothetical protein l11_05660 [Neisseria weaveri LMG 5135]
MIESGCFFLRVVSGIMQSGLATFRKKYLFSNRFIELF